MPAETNTPIQPSHAANASPLPRFTPREWLFFGLMIAAGLLLRWILLDLRPMHHDESLHAMYGRYFFDFPETNYYKYDPMLHGPFLYNMLRFVYNTLGSSIWSVRAPNALLGSLVMLLPLLASRYFTKSTVLLLTAVVALSPTLIYWSRFIREDIPSLCSMLLMVYGFALARPSRKAFFVLFGFAWMFTIKENAFVTTAILLGYLIFDFVFNRLVLGERDTAARRIIAYAAAYRWETVCAAALGVLWYSYLFSAGFRYDQGILDGLYRKSLVYWLHHHSIERIKGPFNFHFYVLSWYELPFVAAFIAHLVTFYRRAPLWAKSVGAAVGIGIVFALLHAVNTPVESFAPWRLFKLKDKLDIIGLFIFLVHPVVITVYHTQRRERALALWGYLFTANLFTYSYLGEKVPWLSIYPFTAGIVYLALYFEHYWKSRPLPAAVSWEAILLVAGSVLGLLTLVFIIEEGYKPNAALLSATVLLLSLGYLEGWRRMFGSVDLRRFTLAVFCVYSLRAAVLTNFTYAGKATEFLSQVHTTPEFHSLVMKLRSEALAPPSGKRPRILGIGESVWPITWYLVDIPEYRFNATDAERPGFTYIFQDYKEPADKLPPGWSALKVPLRGWWVPDYSSMTLKRYLAYSINHTPWNDTGFTELSFLSNPER